MKTLNNILSLFYPRLCAGCGDALQQHEQNICLQCLLHLPETETHKLKGNPLALIFEGRVKVENVASYLYYKKGNNVQHILYSLKYKGQKELGQYLGKRYGEQLKQEPRFQDVDIIVPIPLHRQKERKRGYNQSEWIAKGLSEGMQKPYRTDILSRVQFTETQTRKGRFSRWENVKTVFVANGVEEVKGKHLLVCDDVLTTGATMEAAVQQLLTIEGVRVSVVTLAAAQS
jgi:ComF family protein